MNKETINQFFKRIPRGAAVLLGLGVLAGLAYGRLAVMGGAFGDDLNILWAYQRMGGAGVDAFLSWSRPYSIWIYKLIFPITGVNMHLLNLVTILLRVLSSWMLYIFSRELIDGESNVPWMAAWIALLYPGFTQQAHAMHYLLHFAVLSLALFSLYAMVRAVKVIDAKRRLVWTLLSLASATAHISIEYFIGLELLRSVVLLTALWQKDGKEKAIRRTLAFYWPFLLLLGAYLLWRAALFQPTYPQVTILDALRSQPTQTLLDLLKRAGADMGKVILGAWVGIGRAVFSREVTPVMLLSSGLGAALSFGIFYMYTPTIAEKRKASWQMIALGAAGTLLGGVPLWASGTPLTIAHPWNRTTLCYLAGVSLLTAGCLSKLSRKTGRMLFALLVGLSVIFQMQTVRDYEREWDLARELFAQLVEKAPQLKEDTLVMYDDFPFHYYSANNLNAFLNWVYDPERGDGAERYKIFEIDERLGGALPSLTEGEPVIHNTFRGSTLQALVIALDAEGCLIILDRTNPYLNYLPGITKDAEHLSAPDEVIVYNQGRADLPIVLQILGYR